MPWKPLGSQVFEHWLTCDSRHGAISSNDKPLLPLLQSPIHVPSGFDGRRQADPVSLVTGATSVFIT